MKHNEIEQLHLDILSLCFQAKSKGHDAFYDYSAHVNWATVRVFIGGWTGGWVDESIESERFDYLFTSNEANDLESFNIIINKLSACKKYLQDLINA